MAKPKTLAQQVAAENAEFRKKVYAEHLDANEQHNKWRTEDIDEFRNTAYQEALKDAKDTKDTRTKAKVVEGKAQVAATTEPEPETEKRGPGRPRKNP